MGLVAVAALAACGGGGDGGTGSTTTETASGASAEGVYGGTLTGSASNTFNLLVLENGQFWSLYGVSSSNSLGVAGFVQGTGVSNNGTFTSSDAKDFGYAPAVPGTVSATYNASTPSISGTASTSKGSVSFSGGAIAGSLYNYNTAASLSTISGSWSLDSLTGETVALTVQANGAFTAVSSQGCHMSGTVTPRASGKNVFDMALAFGASPCLLAGQSASGIALAYPVSSGRTQLVIGAVDSTRTYGTGSFGTH
jgi:hypothetical protein